MPPASQGLSVASETRASPDSQAFSISEKTLQPGILHFLTVRVVPARRARGLALGLALLSDVVMARGEYLVLGDARVVHEGLHLAREPHAAVLAVGDVARDLAHVVAARQDAARRSSKPAAAIDCEASPAAIAKTSNIGRQPERMLCARDCTMWPRQPRMSSLTPIEVEAAMRSWKGLRNSRWNW